MFYFFQRAFKRLKPSHSSLPLLQLQRSPCSSSQDVTDGPYGKMPFDIFAKLRELHQQTNANESSVCNVFLIYLFLIIKNFFLCNIENSYSIGIDSFFYHACYWCEPFDWFCIKVFFFLWTKVAVLFSYK